MRNKILSTALLYDDRKNILFSAGASIIVIMLFTFGFFSQPNNFILASYSKHSGSYNVSVDNVGILIFILWVAAYMMLYCYNNKETQYGYLMTQPVSRDSIVITKTIASLMTCVIPLLFYIIIASGLIASNTAYSTSIKLAALRYVFQIVFETFCLTALIVTLLQLISMLFTNNIATLVLPILMVICTALEVTTLTAIISPKIGFVRTFILSIYLKLVSNANPYGLIPRFIDFCNLHKITAGFIFLAMAALFFYLTLLLNRKLKYENLSGIFTFSIIKKIFKIIISVLIVLILGIIFAGICTLALVFISNHSNINIPDSTSRILENIFEYVLVLINIAWIPLSALIYKLISKIEKRKAAV